MPTPLEKELGLGPIMHRVRRWSHSVASHIGRSNKPEDDRLLDPLTVSYAAWREVRKTVREWPQYKEAANRVEILVSPEDWDEYWGIDTTRKEVGIAAYIQTRAAEKALWIAGDPQVLVIPEDTIEPGELEIECLFVEAVERDDMPSSASSTASHPAITSDLSDAATTGQIPRDASNDELTPTTRFIDPSVADEACLTDDNGFRLTLKSGDIIGVVAEDSSVPSEVNIRLDVAGFPYAEPKQCQLAIVEGRWTITNFAARGTKLITTKGERFMLGVPEPFPLEEGDTLFLGPERPLRFSLV